MFFSPDGSHTAINGGGYTGEVWGQVGGGLDIEGDGWVGAA